MEKPVTYGERYVRGMLPASVQFDDPKWYAEMGREIDRMRDLLREGLDGFGRVMVATSDDAAVRNWQKRVRAALTPNAKVTGA